MSNRALKLSGWTSLSFARSNTDHYTRTNSVTLQVDFDLILVNGAPGIGKTTLCQLLGEAYKSPVIDFGLLREFHLDKKWERKSDREEQMTYEVLEQMLDTYLKYELKNIFVNDLKEWRIEELNKKFAATNSIVLSLTIADHLELKRRIEDRDKGWRDVDAALELNKRTLERNVWPNELRVDVGVRGIYQAFQVVRSQLEANNKLHRTQNSG